MKHFFWKLKTKKQKKKKQKIEKWRKITCSLGYKKEEWLTECLTFMAFWGLNPSNVRPGLPKFLSIDISSGSKTTLSPP